MKIKRERKEFWKKKISSPSKILNISLATSPAVSLSLFPFSKFLELCHPPSFSSGAFSWWFSLAVKVPPPNWAYRKLRIPLDWEEFYFPRRNLGGEVENRGCLYPRIIGAPEILHSFMEMTNFFPHTTSSLSVVAMTVGHTPGWFSCSWLGCGPHWDSHTFGWGDMSSRGAALGNSLFLRQLGSFRELLLFESKSV